MKKLITCASLAAVGAASVQAQYLGDQAPQKPWSVSAKLRGFYDDNYATLPAHRTDGGLTKRGSWGTDVNPSASYTYQKELTSVSVRYEGDMRYYADRANNSADWSHQADLKLGQSFTDRYKLDASESFVIAQEPELLNPSGTPGTLPLRVDGNNIRNTAVAGLLGNLTEKFSVHVGYANTFYDYRNKGDGSYAALLNRMEHLGTLDLRWQFQQKTTGILGYQYGQTDYSRNDHLFPSQVVVDQFGASQVPFILPTGPGGHYQASDFSPAQLALANARVAAIPTSKVRNSDSHYLVVGADHSISSTITGKLRVGAMYTEYPNLPAGIKDHNWAPYADASVNWAYSEGCMAQLGVKHGRAATDVALLAFDPATVAKTLSALDLEYTTVYASIDQKVTAKINAFLRGVVQDSTFNQPSNGLANDRTDDFFSVEGGASYALNRFAFLEASYGFDRLSSQIPNRSYSRNRAFVGIRATY